MFGAGVRPPSCPVYAPKQKVGGKAPSARLADEDVPLLHATAQTLAAMRVGWQTPRASAVAAAQGPSQP